MGDGGLDRLAPSRGNHEHHPPGVARQTYASPMSFAGSTRRITSWLAPAARRNPYFAIIIWGMIAPILLLVTWAVVTVWTAVFIAVIVTTPLGWLAGVYRLARRQQRKGKAVQDAQLAALQAVTADPSSAAAPGRGTLMG